jgi:hypothetical protein
MRPDSFSVVMLRARRAVALAAAALLLAGCNSADDSATLSNATINTYHLLFTNGATPPDLDVNINATPFGPVVYLGATTNRPLNWAPTAASVPLLVRPFGAPGTTLLSQNVSPVNRASYTLAIVGETNPAAGAPGPDAVLARRDSTAPQPGRVRVRVLQGQGDRLVAVDVYVGPSGSERQLASGLAFRGVTTYFEIEAPTGAGVQRMVITPAGIRPSLDPQLNQVISFTASDWVAGRIYTVALARSAGGVRIALNIPESVP